MQSNENIRTDARTFPIIWANLTATEKENITYELLKAKCTKTRQTIWNWGKDKARPSSPLIKQAIAKVVGNVLNIRCFGETLFPPRG